MFDIPVHWIESRGFSKYLQFTGGPYIRDLIYPPAGTTEILMGCGPTDKIETRIQLAAIMTPAEIFDRKGYPTYYPTKAKRIRNFFGYEASPLFGQIGFSGSENIYLATWDRYDCKDAVFLGGSKLL